MAYPFEALNAVIARLVKDVFPEPQGPQRNVLTEFLRLLYSWLNSLLLNKTFWGTWRGDKKSGLAIIGIDSPCKRTIVILKNKAKFAPWLAAICRNVAKDIVATEARFVNAENISQVPDSNCRDDTSRMIRQAIEQLPASAKELIVLRYYNNLSYEEISSVLGISKPTINGRLTRAKRRMAEYLKRSGFPENQLWSAKRNTKI